jgi:hypothetical protein
MRAICLANLLLNSVVAGILWIQSSLNFISVRGGVFRVGATQHAKMTVLWDAAPYSLAEIDRCFTGAYCLHHQDDTRKFPYRPGDGGSKHFWNIGQFLRGYTAQHPRRHSSSRSPPWEPRGLCHSDQSAVSRAVRLSSNWRAWWCVSEVTAAA